MKSARTLGLGLIVILAIVLRLLPLPVNVSPIGGLAIFAGFVVRRRSQSFLFPLVALLVSDLWIGFHETMWAVYLSFALMTAIAIAMREGRESRGDAGLFTQVFNRVGATLTGSLLFFFVTNFAVWAQGGLYEPTSTGLLNCYIAGLPFLSHTMIGDMLGMAVLFGAWEGMKRCLPVMQKDLVSN